MTTMINKYFSKICAVLMAVMVFASCERNDGKDPRAAFVGDYTFVTNGSIEIDGVLPPANTLPIHEEGELSIVLADKENAIWMIADNDSSLAYVSGNQFIMEPSTDKMNVGEAVLILDYSYSPAILKDNGWTMISDAEVTATYRDKTLTGSGEVIVTATKK